MALIGREIASSLVERKASRSAPRFAPAGQSTQMIIGASPENDFQILRLSQGLYKKMNLKRVYYSAYVPVSDDNRLPVLAAPPLLREHRLYQADWLLRFYGFSAEEILSDDAPHLDESFDPKTAWALRHPEFFPVEINRADYGTLLRVPGIGVLSAKRIIAARRFSAITPEGMKKIGVVMKRAKYFITCSGRSFEKPDRPAAILRQQLLLGEPGESVCRYFQNNWFFPECIPDTMNRYLYDGTADGLLSAIAWILEEEPDPQQVALAERQDTLFEDGFFISYRCHPGRSAFFPAAQPGTRCRPYPLFLHACRKGGDGKPAAPLHFACFYSFRQG